MRYLANIIVLYRKREISVAKDRRAVMVDVPRVSGTNGPIPDIDDRPDPSRRNAANTANARSNATAQESSAGGFPSWYAGSRDDAVPLTGEARVTRARNARTGSVHAPNPDPYAVARASAASKNADRLWGARQSGAQGGAYYDDESLGSAAISPRTPAEQRHRRQDVERGDQYHQQLEQVRSSMPDGAATRHRVPSTPPAPSGAPRRTVGQGSERERQTQQNRRRVRSHARVRRQRNLFFNERKRRQRRIMVTVAVILVLVVVLVVVLVNASSCAGVPA